MSSDLQGRVLAALRDVPDFPKPGIIFKDITPLLADPALMADVVRAMAEPFADAGVTHVVGVESRGFLFGTPLALHMGAAFAPARKPGKLPFRKVRESFALEYGEDALELHTDAVSATSRVLIVDDVLATGGTAAAAVRLVRRLGGQVVGASFLTELAFLQGRSALAGTPVSSVIAI